MRWWLTKKRDRECTLAKRPPERVLYSTMPDSPSRRATSRCGLIESASAKSTMFARFAYIRKRLGQNSPVAWKDKWMDIKGGTPDGLEDMLTQLKIHWVYAHILDKWYMYNDLNTLLNPDWPLGGRTLPDHLYPLVTRRNCSSLREGPKAWLQLSLAQDQRGSNHGRWNRLEPHYTQAT